MRLLRLAQTAHPDVTAGGAIMSTQKIAITLRLGHDLTVLTVQTDLELPHFGACDGYTVALYDPAVS